MHYNYYFEVCCLIFLIAIAAAYFTRKKFPISLFTIFGITLGVVIFNVIVNIASCLALDYSNKVPIIWYEITRELFFVSQIICSYLLFVYIVYSVGKSYNYQPRYFLTFIPSFIIIIFLFTNPIHHWIISYSLGANGVYDPEKGIMYYLPHAVEGFNFLSTVLYVIYFRKKMSNKLISVLYSILGTLLLFYILEVFIPYHIFSGISYTLALVFAIITVNDPDEKVDRPSKAFTDEAFIEYVNAQKTDKLRKHYIVMDIESFGMFNKVFGVVYSNELVSQIRKFISSVNRRAFIFRAHASRFIILTRNKEEQIHMVESIKDRFASPFNIKDNEMNISIRLFYFENNNYFKDSDSYNDFLSRTMVALKDYKGSNYIELDKEFLGRIERDKKIKDVLDKCLKTGVGLYMVYQPIYDIHNKKFNHCEALIRLSEQEMGYVGPGEFVPIAETFGLANEIDYFVLEETCAFLSRNKDIECLEINVSCAEFFKNPSDRFIKTIEKYKIDPKRICLEITETVAVKYPTKTEQFMADLGQYGIQFAMDDFGSGYSNIARFINLPFSLAKLDKSLLEAEKNGSIFLDFAIQLFKSLKIPIVVEGVENEDRLEFAKSKDIDYIQGYYLSKPLKEKELLEFLQEKAK